MTRAAIIEAIGAELMRQREANPSLYLGANNPQEHIWMIDGEVDLGALAVAILRPPPWLPIETAPHNPGQPFAQPRVELWIPSTESQPGFATHGHYDADTYAKKPRPFWKYDAVLRTTDARARQPTHWRPEPQGPKP